MNPHLFFAFCLAVTILILLPGPIVTLVVANSLSHGRRIGLATALGTGFGNALLLAAVAAGLLTFFSFLSEVFAIIRWAGAAYLIWLGLKAWRGQRAGALEAFAEPARSVRAVFAQGLAIGITNPKAIVFYIAFLPQFIDRNLPVGLQLFVMSSTMIVIALVSDSGYALLSSAVRGWFADPRRRRLHGRIAGTLLIGTGCGLLLTRRGS
jgi:threonine/homoserine/homoserine lactone efflux protein